MPTPTQAQLALERDALKADIADKQALYADLIARGKVNSAQELLGDINKLTGQERTLSNDIKNFTQFSTERASQDAEIAQTQNFESKNSPANQTVTSSSTTSTTTGGTATTTISGAATLSPEAENAAKQANLRASAFTANPSGKIGNNTIDKAVTSGAITPAEAAALKTGAVPEADRFAAASEARAKANATVAAGTTEGPPTTITTSTPNSSGNTTVEQQSVATPPPSINSNSNLTNTATIVTNPDGTKSEVTVNNTTATVTTTPVVDNQLVQGTETTIVASQNVDNTNPALINPNTDPNTNIGAEGQDLVYDPLLEPPITNDGDEFSGIDEQVQRQKDLEDGSLEFAGIDEQIGINENALQEPPLLSDEEIDQQLRLAAQDEQIENKDPADVGEEDPFEAARIRAGEEYDRTTGITEQDIFAAEGVTNAAGLQGKLEDARAQQITQDAENAKTQGDWRVRLSLAPSAGYLYKAVNPGILLPLQKTDGIIFPYTPSIQVTYAAHYDASDLTHSNYKVFQYKNSSVDQISISCDFTAQDTEEANYMLAVIHFFRSVTKMFYGQDQIPKPGTPPPLCYLSGMGDFQFDRHPLAISSFNYSLPTDVDYIRASSPTLLSGVNATGYNDNRNSDLTPQQVRMQSGTTPLNAGATESAPKFGKATNTQPTYVPTKIQIAIVAYPIVTRNDISNNFSLAEYATGKLLQGSKRKGGGIW